MTYSGARKPDGDPLDPHDPGLSRRVEREMRAHLADAEREAAQLAARRRTLADITRRAVERGDLITVSVGGRAVTGTGIYARRDLLTVATTQALVEVNVGAIEWIRVDRAGVSGGRTSPDEAESFEARLRLLELGAETIELLGCHGRLRVRGKLSAVGRDHVAVTASDGKVWYTPLSQVAALLRALPPMS